MRMYAFLCNALTKIPLQIAVEAQKAGHKILGAKAGFQHSSSYRAEYALRAAVGLGSSTALFERQEGVVHVDRGATCRPRMVTASCPVSLQDRGWTK